MTESDHHIFKPVNDPIKSHSQVSSCIEILGFHDMVARGEMSTIQVFYEKIAQEIYNARKKNYSWGFKVIEPEFFNFSDQMVLVSSLFKEEHLADLNSVVFKLFIEFNNIILASALHMHIPIKGIIYMSKAYRGTVKSRKPALVSGKDPLILADLLKVFSIGEIFPNGFSDGMIPAVDIPFNFGLLQSKSRAELNSLESVGIFMQVEYSKDPITDVTILSNMMVETEVNGQKLFACNWKEWMNEHIECSTDNIIAFAEAEGRKNAAPFSKPWKSLANYSAHL